MKKKFLLLLFISFLLQIACTRKEEQKTQKIKTIDIDRFITNEPILFSSVFSDFKMIPLETNENSILSNADEIILINDTLFILDRFTSKSVYIFDVQGNYINKIRKIGKGPGEYLQISGFDVDPYARNILLFDWATQKLNFYDFNGNFLKDISFRESFKSIISTKESIFLSKPLIETNVGDRLILQVDKERHKKRKDFLPLDKQFLKPLSIKFNRGGDFFRGSHSINYIREYDLDIYTLGKKEFEPSIKIATKKYALNDEDISKIKNNPLNHNIKKITEISEFSQNDELISLQLTIGIFRYNLLCQKKSDNVLCSSRFVDDISYLQPNLFRISGNKFIGIVSPIQLYYLKQKLESDETYFPEKVKNEILKLSDNSNPVIVLYEIKKDIWQKAEI